MKNMTDILDKKSIAIIETGTHESVITKLLDLIKDTKKISNHSKLAEQIWERENIISTGIGVGLAIPHTRKNIVKNFVASAVLIRQGVEWNSIDNRPVVFAVLIASPQDTHKEYLRILAQTVLLWKDEEKRTLIINSADIDEIYENLKAIEFDI